MTDELDERVRDWVEDSGRALELRTARALLQMQASDVEMSFAYKDVSTSTMREGDVRATFPWRNSDNIPCSITLTVECKNSAKSPWVAFYGHDEIEHQPNLDLWATFSFQGHKGIFDKLPRRWEGRDPFQPKKISSHIVSALTKERYNPAGDAVRQCLSAAQAETAAFSSGTSRGHVILAAIVTSAPLFECTLDGSGSVDVQPVHSLDVWGSDSRGKRRRVYIRDETSFPTFARSLWQRSQSAS